MSRSLFFAAVLGSLALGYALRDVGGNAALASPTAPTLLTANADHHELKAHIFEQRVYTTAEGKLSNLHARFRDHTNYLFVKHGMKLIGYWTPTDKDNTLIYILAYPSKEARETSWKGFMGDEEWKRVWAESKKNAGGAIVTKVVSTFLNPTDYSPLR